MYYSPNNKIFNCAICQSKETLGCEKDNIADIPFKPPCICHGLNDKCEICQGKGHFTMRRCPIIALSQPSIRRLVPYFFEWKNDGRYPDGQGRVYQPIKLMEAFSLCNAVCQEQEMKPKV